MRLTVQILNDAGDVIDTVPVASSAEHLTPIGGHITKAEQAGHAVDAIWTKIRDEMEHRIRRHGVVGYGELLLEAATQAEEVALARLTAATAAS